MRTLSAAIIVLLVAVLGPTGIAAADEETFRARLTGDQEVPPVDTAMTGKVKIQFDEAFSEAEFTLTVNDGVRVQQAHIHCAPAGVNGPIIIFLAGFHAPGWDVDGKWISNARFTNANIVNTACGTTLAEIAESMRNGNTYANVHTVAHPGGEIRGVIEQK